IVQHALAIERAASAGLERSRGVAVAKESFKRRARIDLGVHRLRLRPPRNVELIGATVSRVARTGALTAIAAQLERSQPRLVTDAICRNLIRRDPGLDVGAG